MSFPRQKLAHRTWCALEVKLDAEACEAVEYGFMEAGSLGTETSSSDERFTRITGYFTQPPNVEELRSKLIEALRIYDLRASTLRELSLREIEDRDWLAEWKKDWRPVQVGRFIIAPPWLEPPPVSSATTSGSLPLASAGGSSEAPIVIHINPGMAFGTGTHETTRLCLKAIEKYFRGGSLLDVGTGTGILAIAAVKMFPDAYIEACDTDGDAIAIAKENARSNNVEDQIDFRVGSVDEETPSADLVSANLTAPVIVELLPLLLGVSCGRLILSGILNSQIEMVQSRLLELGAADLEFSSDGEWFSIVVSRAMSEANRYLPS
jgi:ribosomal protein L11 methyltransferase